MRARAPLSLQAFGERKTLIEWSRDPRCQVPLRELISRTIQGWDPEKALVEPAEPRRREAKNIIEAFGEQKTAGEWARDDRATVSSLTIAARVQRGWNPEEAILTPVHGKPRVERPASPRPPRARRPRTISSMEPIEEISVDSVKERLRGGAELWFAGLAGERLTLVEGDHATRIDPNILAELTESGFVVEICQVGSVKQYGLAPQSV